MNNIFDENEKGNFLFLASVIAVLCENSPITISLEDIEKFWNGEIRRLKYHMIVLEDSGNITFSLTEKE